MQFKIYRAKEDELIQGCLRRERSAQKLLFDTFSSKMYSLCYRYVKNDMEAEDVLVTSFTKVFEKIKYPLENIDKIIMHQTSIKAIKSGKQAINKAFKANIAARARDCTRSGSLLL